MRLEKTLNETGPTATRIFRGSLVGFAGGFLGLGVVFQNAGEAFRGFETQGRGRVFYSVRSELFRFLGHGQAHWPVPRPILFSGEPEETLDSTGPRFADRHPQSNGRVGADLGSQWG